VTVTNIRRLLRLWWLLLREAAIQGQIEHGENVLRQNRADLQRAYGKLRKVRTGLSQVESAADVLRRIKRAHRRRAGTVEQAGHTATTSRLTSYSQRLQCGSGIRFAYRIPPQHEPPTTRTRP